MASSRCPNCLILEREVETLRRALESRDVIGQAKGLVMATVGCDADAAFQVLRERSQHENRKVRDVAAELVSATRRATGRGAFPLAPVHVLDYELGPTLVGRVSSHGTSATLELHGEGDYFCAVALRELLDELLVASERLVVDLRAVSFCDSRFVGTLQQAAVRHHPTPLSLRNVPPLFDRITDIFQLGRGSLSDSSTRGSASAP